jgi:TM2 domain-containing membrane protein YozV
MKMGSPTLAALMSLVIPGLGQFYNGQLIKGLVISIVALISFVLIFFMIGIFMYPTVALLAALDAYGTANK